MKQLRFELMMKVASKEVELGFVHHIGKEGCTGTQEAGGGLFGHYGGWRDVLRSADLRPTIPKDGFRHHDQPHIGTPFIRAQVIQNGVLEQLYGRTNGIVPIGFADRVFDVGRSKHQLHKGLGL
jgi:hypothetical protein